MEKIDFFTLYFLSISALRFVMSFSSRLSFPVAYNPYLVDFIPCYACLECVKKPDPIYKSCFKPIIAASKCIIEAKFLIDRVDCKHSVPYFDFENFPNGRVILMDYDETKKELRSAYFEGDDPEDESPLYQAIRVGSKCYYVENVDLFNIIRNIVFESDFDQDEFIEFITPLMS